MRVADERRVITKERRMRMQCREQPLQNQWEGQHIGMVQRRQREVYSARAVVTRSARQRRYVVARRSKYIGNGAQCMSEYSCLRSSAVAMSVRTGIQSVLPAWQQAGVKPLLCCREQRF